MEITIIRTCYPSGTNGKLYHEGRLICYSIELPWKNNERKVSCIPEGCYSLKKQYTAKFGEHMEVTEVSGRSLKEQSCPPRILQNTSEYRAAVGGCRSCSVGIAGTASWGNSGYGRIHGAGRKCDIVGEPGNSGSGSTGCMSVRK